jgi:hypothetical protein
MAGLSRAVDIKFERTRASVGDVGDETAVEVTGRDEWGLMFSGTDLEPDEVLEVANKATRTVVRQLLARATALDEDVGEITVSISDALLVIRSAWLDGLQLGEIHGRMET